MENKVSRRYSHKYQGGFLKYIDTLQANLYELDILLPGHYPEDCKKRILFKNFKEVKSLIHLVQACKDRDLSYQEAATYLRKHGAELYEEDEDLKMTNQAEIEVKSKYLNYGETKEKSMLMKRLGEEIKIEIGSIRKQLNDKDNREQPTTTSIPPQYGHNRKTLKWNDREDRLADDIHSYESHDALFSDDDVRMGAMMHRVGEEVEVQTYKETSKVIPTRSKKLLSVKENAHIQGREDSNSPVPTNMGNMAVNPAYHQKFKDRENAVRWREMWNEVDSTRIWKPGE